jgi:hypothetical protein
VDLNQIGYGTDFRDQKYDDTMTITPVELAGLTGAGGAVVSSALIAVITYKITNRQVAAENGGVREQRFKHGAQCSCRRRATALIRHLSGSAQPLSELVFPM